METIVKKNGEHLTFEDFEQNEEVVAFFENKQQELHNAVVTMYYVYPVTGEPYTHKMAVENVVMVSTNRKGENYFEAKKYMPRVQRVFEKIAAIEGSNVIEYKIADTVPTITPIES